MTIGELIVTLGFKADTVKLKDFAKEIGQLPVDVALGLAAMVGLEYELAQVTRQALEAAASFQNFTAQTGLSAQELQKWQIVAVQANVSAEAVASSVTNLQRQLAEISLGRGNVSPYQLLGIDPHQDAFGVLKQLRGAIQGLNPAMATNLISQMGIDPSMIHVLQLSNAEFTKLAQTVKGMSSDQEGSFLRAKQTIEKFGLQLKYLGFDVVAHLIDGLSMLGSWFQRLQLWTPGLVAAFEAILVAIQPVVGAVTALLLVLDDLSVYSQGGKSVIGLAVEGFKKLGAAIGTTAHGSSPLAFAGGLPMYMMTHLPTIAANMAVQSARGGTTNTTINVHSTAPAHEVAKEVKRHIDRQASNASLQTNQQGY